MKHKQKLTKEYLIGIIKDYANQHGRPPTRRELNSNPSLPSDMTYRRMFGSWGAALQSAGFEIPKPFPSEQCIAATVKVHKGRKGYHNKGGVQINKQGYICVWNTDKQKYELEHRIVMAKYIGRELTDKEDVHHINSDKTDNRIENLQLMSRSEHSRLHEELGHHRHTQKVHPCVFPNCSNLAFGNMHLCQRHYKRQWYRLKKGLVTSMMDFKDIERKHSSETKQHLSELAKQQPRKNGRFCSTHDHPSLLKGE